MNVSRDNILREITFKPYCRGGGPTFSLTTWDTGRTGFGGKYLVGYRLTMHETYWTSPPMEPVKTIDTVLFEGEDFGCSPAHAIDSDEAIEGIMSFLTLRPGDTDKEYFVNYTPEQLDCCSSHAEYLSCAVQDWSEEKCHDED